MKKLLIFTFFTLILNAQAIGKETTYKKELFDKGDIKERQYLMNAISSMRGKLGTEKHMIKVRNSVVESGPRKVYNVKMHRTKLVKLYDHSILGDEDLDDMSEFKVELFIRNLVSLN